MLQRFAPLIKSYVPLKNLVILSILVAGDIGTTILAQYLLGPRFIEQGTMNGLFIKKFGALWFLHAYPVELAIWGVMTILLAATLPNKKLNLRFVKLDMWALTFVFLGYLIVQNVFQGTVVGYIANH